MSKAKPLTDMQRIIQARLRITQLHKELLAINKHAMLCDISVVLGDVRDIDKLLNPELFARKARKK